MQVTDEILEILYQKLVLQQKANNLAGKIDKSKIRTCLWTYDVIMATYDLDGMQLQAEYFLGKQKEKKNLLNAEQIKAIADAIADYVSCKYLENKGITEDELKEMQDLIARAAKGGCADE